MPLGGRGVTLGPAPGSPGEGRAAWTRLTLTILDGARAGEILDLKGPATLGREAGLCEVVLPEGSISRRHARLGFSGGQWQVQDLGTTNGTLLDGQPVGAVGRPLGVGGLLTLGGGAGVRCRYEILPAEAPCVRGREVTWPGVGAGDGGRATPAPAEPRLSPYALAQALALARIFGAGLERLSGALSAWDGRDPALGILGEVTAALGDLESLLESEGQGRGARADDGPRGGEIRTGIGR